MDVSVFNLLMSTTPNASAAENIFGNGSQTATDDATKAQEALRTGEAFLAVLEQTRTGKTEKSAEAFLNIMTAKADASSSLKNIGKGNESRQDVKVLKLHLKRTRASEKMQAADQTKNTAAQDSQNRQKIPAQANISTINEAGQITETETGVSNAENQAFSTDVPVFESISKPTVSKETMTEEPMAADLLITACLQTNVVQMPQTQTAADFETQEIVQVQEEQTTQAETPEMASLSENDIPVETADALPGETKTPAKTADNQNPAQQNFEKTVLPQTAQTVETTDKKVTDNDKISSFKSVFTQTDKPENISTAPAQISKPIEQPSVLKKQEHNVSATPVQTIGITPNESDFEKQADITGKKEARHQAAQLAAQLPETAKIAVTVETNAPAIKAFNTIHTPSEKTRPEQKGQTAQTSLFADQEAAPAPIEQNVKSFENKPISNNPPRAQADNQPSQNLQNGLAALPTEQKSFSSVVQNTSATESISGINNTASGSGAANGQAFIAPGQTTLKGKAVTGSTPLPKTTPMNELADQVKINIKKAVKAGLDKIDVILKPKELGTIRVHLEIDKDGNMKATLSTARPETLDLLRADLSTLKQALADSGFNMNDEAFAFNYRGEHFNDNDRHSAPEERNTDGSSSIEDDILDSEAEQTAAVSGISGRHALNIRV